MQKDNSTKIQTEFQAEKAKESLNVFFENLVKWFKILKIQLESLLRKLSKRIQIYKMERKLLHAQAEFGKLARDLILQEAPEWAERSPKLSEMIQTIDKMVEDIKILELSMNEQSHTAPNENKD